MTLPNSSPQREVTPEERRRSVRMFWMILLLFPTLIGVGLAVFAFQGRGMRDYGQAVLREVSARPQPFHGSAECAEVAAATKPAGVKTCTVSATPGGGLNVVIDTERGQQYRLSKTK